MPANYHRPGTDYVPVSRPNDKKFEIYTRNNKRPVPDIIYDQEFGNLIDIANVLDGRIDNAQIAPIPGVGDANNINKMLTLSQLNTVSWIDISAANILDESIPGIKLIAQTITQRELQDGGIITSKIAQKAITTELLDDESVDTDQLAEESVTADKIASGTITNEEIADGTIRATELAADSVTTQKILNSNVTLAKLAQDVIDFMNSLVPIGSVIELPITIPVPSIYKEANGQLLSRAAYPALFAAYGTTFGAGDGTNFGLPDKRGRASVGIGSDNSTGDPSRITAATAANITLGGTFGAETHQLTVAELASHTHSILPTLTTLSSGVSASGFFNGDGAQTSSTGGDSPHNNTQPSIFTRYYVRAL